MLLDIGLPELDGFEVAKRIRQDPLLHDIVLVAMTGYGQASDRQPIAGGRVRSLPGQARRLREGASNLGGSLGEGDLTPTERPSMTSIQGRAQAVGWRKERTYADDREDSSGSRGR